MRAAALLAVMVVACGRGDAPPVDPGTNTPIDPGPPWQLASNGLEGSPVAQLAIDEQTPDRLYAVGRTDGAKAIYRSDDGARSWSRAHAGPLPFDLTLLVVDPSHAGALFAVSSGGDIQRSADAGATWLAVGPGPAAVTRALGVDRAGMLYALASASPTLWRSADAGISWTQVFTWSTTACALDVAGSAIALAGIGAQGPAAAVSQDGGATWTQGELVNDLRFPYWAYTRCSVRLAASRPGVAYLGLTAYHVRSPRPSIDTLMLLQRFEAGAFTNVAPGPPLVSSSAGAWADLHELAVGPGSSTVYVTGLGCPGEPCPVESFLVRSTDDGASWTDATPPDATGVAGIAIDPRASDTVYVGTAQGVFKTTTGGR